MVQVLRIYYIQSVSWVYRFGPVYVYGICRLLAYMDKEFEILGKSCMHAYAAIGAKTAEAATTKQ